MKVAFRYLKQLHREAIEMGDLSYHLDAKDKTLNDLYRSTGKVDRMERQLAALEPLLSSLQLSAQS